MAEKAIEEVNLDPALVEEVLGYHNVHAERVQKTDGTAIAFYSQLAAFSAASIALAVSAGLTIMDRANVAHKHSLVHGLLAVNVVFWLSFLCALGHNCLLVWAARYLDRYSFNESVKKMVSALLRSQKTPDLDEAQVRELEKLLHVGSVEEQGKFARRERWCKALASNVATASVVSFVTGYTMVVAGAFMLWL